MKKHIIKGQYRQGDVLITNPTIDFDLQQAKKVNQENDRTVLEFGEVTGHAHALYDKTSALYEWDGDRLLQTIQSTEIKHEEHSTIQLKPGIKEIRRQTEYNPAEIRNIAD